MGVPLGLALAPACRAIRRLEEVDDGLWDAYYSYVRLGPMDERTYQVEDILGRRMRNPKV